MSTARSLVVVDGLAINEASHVIQACEAKSGNNVEIDQAKKYQVMTATEIARQITVPPSLSANVHDTTVEVLYACLEGSEDRIRLGIDQIGAEFSLLIVGDGQVRLSAAAGSTTPSFSVAVPQGPPPRLIPVDAESPAEEFRELLLPAVMAAGARSEEVVAVDSLLDRSVPYWSVFGTRQREALRGKAAQVLRLLAEGDFGGDFRVEAGGAGVVGTVLRILRSPAAYDARGETQGWQRLRRQGERALRGVGRRRLESPGQISFEDLVREIETEQT